MKIVAPALVLGLMSLCGQSRFAQAQDKIVVSTFSPAADSQISSSNAPRPLPSGSTAGQAAGQGMVLTGDNQAVYALMTGTQAVSVNFAPVSASFRPVNSNSSVNSISGLYIEPSNGAIATVGASLSECSGPCGEVSGAWHWDYSGDVVFTPVIRARAPGPVLLTLTATTASNAIYGTALFHLKIINAQLGLHPKDGVLMEMTSSLDAATAAKIAAATKARCASVQKSVDSILANEQTVTDWRGDLAALTKGTRKWAELNAKIMKLLHTVDDDIASASAQLLLIPADARGNLTSYLAEAVDARKIMGGAGVE